MVEVRLLRPNYVKGGSQVGDTFEVTDAHAQALVATSAAERVVEVVIPTPKSELKPRGRKPAE